MSTNSKISSSHLTTCISAMFLLMGCSPYIHGQLPTNGQKGVQYSFTIARNGIGKVSRHSYYVCEPRGELMAPASSTKVTLTAVNLSWLMNEVAVMIDNGIITSNIKDFKSVEIPEHDLDIFINGMRYSYNKNFTQGGVASKLDEISKRLDSVFQGSGD